MKKLLIYGLLITTLFGCAKSQEEELKDKRAELDAQVQELVKKNLKDPQSAQFRNQHELCGEVNSKNSFGGYNGFTRFIITEDRVFFESEYKGDQYSLKLYQQLWKEHCN